MYPRGINAAVVGHATSLVGWRCQFHGSNSSILWAVCPAMRARTSASQACGSTSGLSQSWGSGRQRPAPGSGHRSLTPNFATVPQNPSHASTLGQRTSAEIPDRRRTPNLATVPVGTALTEGTANFLVNRRMAKAQQMRWTRRAADLLLQVRCPLYNGTLGTGFGQKFLPANDLPPPMAVAA